MEFFELQPSQVIKYSWIVQKSNLWPADSPSPAGNASPGNLRPLRFLEMTGCAFRLVAATGIAEPDDMVVIFGERIGQHRLAGPSAVLINAIGNRKRKVSPLRSAVAALETINNLLSLEGNWAHPRETLSFLRRPSRGPDSD